MNRFLFAVFMMLTTVVANAVPAEPRVTINGVELKCAVLKGRVAAAFVPAEHNTTFLKGVFCGDAYEMTKADVNVAEWEDTPNYTAAIVSVRLKDADGQYYLITYKPKGGIIDGALLLCENDIRFAENLIENMNLKPGKHEFALEKNAATVTRNFETIFNTGRGGPLITEEGSVTMRFDIDQSGNISRPDDGVTEKSLLIIKPNMSVPGQRHDNIETRNSDNCKSLGMGWNVIMFYTHPASDKNLAEYLNTKLEPVCNMAKEDDMSTRHEGEKDLLMFKNWQKRLMYRNTEPWLDWLSNNQNSNCMNVLKKNLAEDEAFNGWFRNEVKTLGNKKLKKAWDKLLK